MPVRTREVWIADRRLAVGEPCFVIAEAGVNHNGELGRARELVAAAAAAGADAIKFQAFRARELVTPDAPRASYQERNAGAGTQSSLLEALELPPEAFGELRALCDELGLVFLITPHTEMSLAEIEPLVPAFKVGSGDLTNDPLLRSLAPRGKPILLATGMADRHEVARALELLEEAGDPEVVVLHCTTSYPCPLEDVHLNAMVSLGRELDVLVGYSDHTLGIEVPIVAATLGAVCLEKHFTLDRDLPGPDHRASLEPAELGEMVRAIRAVPVIRGSGEKRPTAVEKEMRATVRKSLVTVTPIHAGETVRREMIAVKRPGHGIPPRDLERLLGRTAAVAIPADTVLEWSHFA